jgi:glycosyltransferase involved in cell wall biosynthesis
VSFVNPFVSIVFTTYNSADFIRTSLSAALTQNYPNFEVIVADDGSTDETEQICREIEDSRLRILKLGRVGRSKALNAAVKAAGGRYIANNDADDVSLPYRLAYAVDFLETHGDVAYITTDVVRAEVFSNVVPPELCRLQASALVNGATWHSRANIYRRNLFNHSTLVYPKSTWQAIGGYDETLDVSEDYDFYLRALQCGRAGLLPGKTVIWCSNSNGYFRQKGMIEYLRVMLKIKRRAHRLLQLPSWLLLYHYLWTFYYCLQRFGYDLFMVKRNTEPQIYQTIEKHLK